MLGRAWLVLAAACTVSATALALEGAPPFEWLVSGDTVPESTAAASVSPDAGLGLGFAGSGAAQDSMKVRRYIAAPLTIRYGLWDAIEAYAVAPFYWGASPQHFVNYPAGGLESRETLTGADFGDPSLGVRWRAWRNDEGHAGMILTAAYVFPFGTNVWHNSQANFANSGGIPDLAIGDGANKLLIAAQVLADGPAWRVEVLGGYLWRLPFVETQFANDGTIDVREPSPVLGWIRPSFKLTEDTWLTGQVDGFWAAGGGFTLGGDLAKDPGQLPVILDSYQHLIRSAGGVWAGLGLRQAFTETWTAAVGVLAPVAVHGMYRLIRLDATLAWSWKP